MPRAFALPDLGEGLTEAQIVRVLVHEGDVIGEDTPLLEVETEVEGKRTVLSLKPGDCLHIIPLMRHRMIAVEDSDVLEGTFGVDVCVGVGEGEGAGEGSGKYEE